MKKYGSSKSNVNRDDNNLFKANAWAPLLSDTNDLGSALLNQRSSHKVDLTPN